MNPVLGIIGNMLGGSKAGNAQVNSATGNMGSMGNTGNLNSILSLFGMLKGTSNPMQTLRDMSQNNPQIKQVFDYVQQNGGDMQSAFYKLAEQRGVDPNRILNLIK